MGEKTIFKTTMPINVLENFKKKCSENNKRRKDVIRIFMENFNSGAYTLELRVDKQNIEINREKKNLTVSVPTNILEEFKENCYNMGLPANGVIELFLRQYNSGKIFIS